MKVQNETVVSVLYELYIKGETPDTEELIEKAPEGHPLVYCHGEGMMLPAFEKALEGKTQGDTFDFVIPCADAYGEYDNEGLIELDKKMFYNGDGEFDSERVYEGAVVPMNTSDGQIINAQIDTIGENTVTIDLNHPFAGEDLHFKGTIVELREALPAELDAIRHPKKGGCCGGCNGGNCGGNCGGDTPCPL